MKLTGRIETVTLSRETRKPLMVIELDRDSAEIDDLIKREKVSIEIKPYHKSRSLNANAYAWVLIDKLAEKLNLSPEKVYRETIRNIGGVCEIVNCNRNAVERLKSTWESHGIGWQVDTVDMGGDWIICFLYYGSSVYDTAQMTRLIDTLVQECKEQDIDVMSEEERSLLLEQWSEK